MQSATTTETPVAAWREKAVYAILFSLPLAGASVRHWLSIGFTALVLLGLPEVFRRRRPLAREEYVLLAVLVAFFVTFVLSALVNGWGAQQTRNLGTEMRYLFIPAVYLLLRRTPQAGTWLLWGGVAGGFTVGLHALYDIYVAHQDRAWGIYGPLLLGPYAALLAMFNLVFWDMVPKRVVTRLVIGASTAGALVALALSGARGGYLSLVGMLAVWAMVRFRGLRLAAAVAFGAAALAGAYLASDQVRDRVDVASNQLYDAVRTDDYTHVSGRLDPIAARVEMWHVSMLIFRDNPVWGVGRGNYTEAARQYVEQGKVHFEVAEHSHPHNAYLEALVSKGIPGLVVLLAMLLYPLSFFVRGLRRSPDTALLGSLLIVGIALFSLTETAPFVKNNFIAIFLIYLCTFFLMHRRRLRREEA